MALHHPLPDVIAYFQLARGLAITPRYNLAPTQAIPVIRQEGAERVLREFRGQFTQFKRRPIGRL